jgi:16S rRNA (uracil1498-N3)-methyltransferase
MSRKTPRLFVDQPAFIGRYLSFTRDHAHYLLDVMRLKSGDKVIVFNGRDGEWHVELTETGRRKALGKFIQQTRPQPAFTGPDLCFAPVKKTGTYFIVEKATELGVRSLRPITTEFTDRTQVKVDRLRANAIEAAEQCGRIDVPDVHELLPLRSIVDNWPASQTMLVADETGNGDAPLSVILTMDSSGLPPTFVIGPQGGFSETELVFLRALPFVTTVDLGPRILRAETAAVAVLSCWQAARGDWI